ncbi:Oxidoreductase [Psilocybe cubensis]|uniref:NAD(P)-binding protein n=2 Tax=Psilocybe cubensis TaxID=181762 RepID=A0A8H7XQ40_PSICU|nr:Oxidoreductase [Psilocybe cubensis]KAH9476980.1 Oxidoreductase [Psilocybe cubensis]
MPSFLVAQNSNASYTPSYVPVMVITGATSGIGQAITQTLARHLHGRVHIIIIARNSSAASRIISTLPTHPAAIYEFIACDVSLMQNVHALAQDLSARLPKLNFLVHCAGVFGLDGRRETEEGIDVKLASRYYARFTLTYDLLPLLRKATERGEPASVLTVLGAGSKGTSEVDLDDLGLKKRYTGWKAMMASIDYNDLMVAEFSKREPNIAFTHIFPGFVSTAILHKSSNPISKLFLFFLSPLLWLITRTQETCAEYMLYALIQAERGMYRRNENGDDIGLKGFPRFANDAQRILWEHSLQATSTSTS